MKKQTAMLLVLTLLAVPGFISAQTRQVIKAQVPFDFIVNGKIMPAGECAIESRGDGKTYLLISSGSRSMYVVPNATESLKVAAVPTLRFHQYGNQYFLSSISQQGESRGFALVPSKAEKELLAQNPAERDVTVVAALQ